MVVSISNLEEKEYIDNIIIILNLENCQDLSNEKKAAFVLIMVV